MFRSYLIASLALSGLLIFGGCAGKTTTEPEEITPPIMTETTTAPTTVEEIIPDSPKVEPVEAAMPEPSKIVTIYFDYDSSVLTEQAGQQLKADAEWLKANPTVKATLEGYCDERGSDEYNLALGERRAETAQKYLTELGIPMEQIATVSFGEERPVDPGHSELAWVKNRRVEFKEKH